MMLAQQTVFPNDSNGHTLQQSEARDEAKQLQGLNQALLATLAAQNMNSTSFGSLSGVQTSSLPLGYPLGIGTSIPPSLQAQLLMRRQLMNTIPSLTTSSQFPLVSNSSTLAPLASGIQALQGALPQKPSTPVKTQGRPNAAEIKKALATLAAAAAPVITSSAPIKGCSDMSQASLPVVVFMDCDEESLSDYQCMLRKQIELFEATSQDVQWNAQGRNKPIVLGQVGIRCRWCANLPTWSRSRGAVYYSATLDGLYQAAQNMAKNHICKNCRYIPADARQNLNSLRECKRRAAGGKKYWAEGAKVLGIYECQDGLRFKNSKIAPTTQCVEIKR